MYNLKIKMYVKLENNVLTRLSKLIKIKRYKRINKFMLGEPKAERYENFHTDPYYLIRLIPAEGSNQVAPSDATKRRFFLCFKRF